VAALIGGREVDAALRVATSKFVVLPLSQLTAADLTSGSDLAADLTSLSARTRPAALGDCSAFVSHSWSDKDGERKYNLLCDHKWDTPEPPTIWLDKACIDQSDIDTSLAVLPIFLAGSDTLFILYGATYATRLWCIMEIFVSCRCTMLVLVLSGWWCARSRRTASPSANSSTASTHGGRSASCPRTVRSSSASSRPRGGPSNPSTPSCAASSRTGSTAPVILEGQSPTALQVLQVLHCDACSHVRACASGGVCSGGSGILPMSCHMGGRLSPQGENSLAP